LYFFFAAKNCVVSVVLSVLVTPALVAACVSVKVKLNESTAIAAIKVLGVRIKFLPMSKPFNRSTNAECQSQFLCCPLRANGEHRLDVVPLQHIVWLNMRSWT
jgi:hypothetical protein